MSIPKEVKLVVTTQSQVMYYNNLPAPVPPQITMNGVPLPSPGQLNYVSGYQVVVIDSTSDYTNPDNILSNTYVGLFSQLDTNSWMSTYPYMYSNMVHNILTAGNVEEQLVIIASFGMDYNIAPTNEAYEKMLSLGAGKQLQAWESNPDIGSQVDNPNSWISFPANYILVGFSDVGYAQGYEAFQHKQDSVTTSLQVTLENPVPPVS
ncbi:MAG: hypothetical protein PVH61_04440 [Candidatus Aminicenantes bacterium]|jgi:hypothetical protein